MPLFSRDDFPALESGLIYLDSAATSLKPRPVIDEMMQFYLHDYATVHRAIYKRSVDATEKYNGVRRDVGQFLNAASENEIVVTKGTTESLNLLAHSLGESLRPGDEILISEMEHHSNIVPWQIVAQKRQAILKVIPITDSGEIDLDAYKKLLSNRTKIVSIVHLSNVLGTINPVTEMGRLAHDMGALFIVDGAQSTPHMPIDVQALGCDFFVFSSHKMFGPTGVGVLYGKAEHLDRMPPFLGGGDMVDQVAFHRTTFQKAPLKFEAGTPPIAEVIGLGSAIRYIEHHGRDAISKYTQALSNEAWQLLSQLTNFQPLAIQKGPIISFNLGGQHPLDMGTFLDLKGIAVRTGHLCAQPLLRRYGVTSAIRLSLAPYNTADEIRCFVEALEAISLSLK
jgi:cysteine desulfurase/selenocysteine lyase